MKHIRSILTAAILLTGIGLFAQGLEFTDVSTQGDFEKILKKAEKSNQIIVVDFYADWCGWCKRMEANIFADKYVKNVLEGKMLTIRVTDEDEVYTQMSDDYGIENFPTLIYILPDGTLIRKAEGYQEVQEFVDLSNECIVAGAKLSEAKKEFDKNPNDLVVISDYLSVVCKLGGISVDEAILDKYFASVRLNSSNAEQFYIIAASEKEFSSEKVQYVVSHIGDYYQLVGEDVLYEYVLDVYSENYQRAVYAEDENILAECFSFLRDVESYLFADTDLDEVITKQQMQYWEYIEDWNRYAQESIKLMKESETKDSEAFFEYIVNIFLNVEQREYLELADDITESMYDADRSFNTCFLYALTRIKCDDEIEAKKLLDKAYKLASDEDEEGAVEMVLAMLEE